MELGESPAGPTKKATNTTGAVRPRWCSPLTITLLTGLLAVILSACSGELPPSSTLPAGPAPMASQEAVSSATRPAQWPAIPHFGTMVGEPSAAAGKVAAYGEAYGYCSDSPMDRGDAEIEDTLVWLVIFEGEIYGKCDLPGCSHSVGPRPDWPKEVGEDEWKQSLIVMDAATGELVLRSTYHEGRLRSTEGLEDLSAYLSRE